MTCYDPFLFSGAPAAHQALWMERSEMRPVLWVPGLYARLVELPAAPTRVLQRQPFHMGRLLTSPHMGGVGLGPWGCGSGSGLHPWDTRRAGKVTLRELGGSAESPGPRE